MQELTPPKPIEDMTDEEATAFLEQTQAYVVKNAGKARQAFVRNIKWAEDRLKHATQELARIDDLRKQLEAHRNLPEGRLHHDNSELLHRVFSATKAMMDVQIACNKHNIEIIDAADPTTEVKFQFAEESLTFLEARARMDTCLTIFHWGAVIEGVDAIMRVSVNQKPIAIQSPEEETIRQALADELKAAMQGDRSLALLVGQLGTELQETEALVEWAKDSLRRLKDLPDASKWSSMNDADWMKLNAKVVMLGELGQKVKNYPVLAKVIPLDERAPLPYEQVSMGEGTGRLGQTGRLQGAAQGRTGSLGK